VDVDDLASQEHPPKRSGRGRAAAPGVVARLGHPQEPAGVADVVSLPGQGCDHRVARPPSPRTRNRWYAKRRPVPARQTCRITLRPYAAGPRRFDDLVVRRCRQALAVNADLPKRSQRLYFGLTALGRVGGRSPPSSWKPIFRATQPSWAGVSDSQYSWASRSRAAWLRGSD
jgi:hypothetical protein